VVELVPGDVRRIAEFRRVLEPRVMEWAARRITPEQVAELEAHLARISAAAAASDYAEFFHEDLLFHRKIWDISQNRYAAKALEAALGSLFALGMTDAQAGGPIDLPEEVRKHTRLLRALQSHDAKLASKILAGMARAFERQLQPQ
jgi:GntR family transcriptional repressor for pyruvate dehydrogenase complex